MNHIRRYYWQCSSGNKYSLKLSCDYLRGADGKHSVKYNFRKNNITLFEGTDFHPSPLYDAIGIKSAYALLGFLTLQIGDTDKEYFENYTQEQLDFCQSSDCEELSYIVYDYENKKG